jgi:hypothetical protein
LWFFVLLDLSLWNVLLWCFYLRFLNGHKGCFIKKDASTLHFEIRGRHLSSDHNLQQTFTIGFFPDVAVVARVCIPCFTDFEPNGCDKQARKQIHTFQGCAFEPKNRAKIENNNLTNCFLPPVWSISCALPGHETIDNQSMTTNQLHNCPNFTNNNMS